MRSSPHPSTACTMAAHLNGHAIPLINKIKTATLIITAANLAAHVWQAGNFPNLIKTVIIGINQAPGIMKT